MALVSARGNGAHVDENVLIRFAQKLACNEKKVRDRALNKLRKWIENRSQIAAGTNGGFTEEDFMKIWKGLHYCLWMSDKPLVQEDVATNIASLILCFSHIDTSLVFIKAFFKTISREWNLIDRQRLDKFMTLVRRCLAASFDLLKKRDWEESTVTQFLKVLFASIVTWGNDRVPDGLKFHVLDIFFEELEKVAKGTLGAGEIQLFLDPFCITLARTTNKRIFAHIMKEIFHRILRESSAKNEDDDEGRCRLQFDLEAIHVRLFLLASGKTCVDRNRAKIYELVKRYRDVCTNSSLPPQENGTSHLSVFEPDTDSSSSVARHKQQNNLKGRMEVDESEGSERVKEKGGKKRHKGKEKTGDKSAKKRKHEKEDGVVSCNGQLDDDPGLTKIKRKKNRNKDAAQNPTTCLFPKSPKQNCEIVEMNGQVNGEVVTSKNTSKKPVQVNHTPDDAGDKGSGKQKSNASGKEGKGKASGKNVSKRDSKENDLTLTPHIHVNERDDKESDTTLAVNMGASSAKKLKKKNSFASFSSPSNSSAQSAVFLKHAMKKVSPKADQKKKRKVSPASSLSASAKKRVIFAMGKNTSQEFIDSFTASPVAPFNPVQKPGQGILKSPASLGASPVSSLTSKLLAMRSRATDYF